MLPFFIDQDVFQIDAMVCFIQALYVYRSEGYISEIHTQISFCRNGHGYLE